jgi:hypothetical protein
MAVSLDLDGVVRDRQGTADHEARHGMPAGAMVAVAF